MAEMLGRREAQCREGGRYRGWECKEGRRYSGLKCVEEGRHRGRNVRKGGGIDLNVWKEGGIEAEM